MKATVAVLPGDGIGPEVTEEAVKVIDEINRLFGHDINVQYGIIGGVAIDNSGCPLPEQTLALCKKADAVLLGAVGGPKWDHLPGPKRPESGLLALRKELSVFANVRPIEVWPPLSGTSPLRREVLEGTNFVILRELTGGLYFGQPKLIRETEEGLEAVDTLIYNEREIERIVRKGFEFATQRRNKLTSVDKANVLESSRLWRKVVERIADDFPQVKVNHLLVDAAAMQLVQNPAQFDVVVTENMFGDILSDEAAILTGSIGMLPSASLSEGGSGLYEPIHGTAPDIAGQNVANPLAAILSVAMLYRYSFSLLEEADAVEASVRQVIEQGNRTKDLAGPNEQVRTTSEMGSRVREALKRRVENAKNLV
jgi:3-isopropylmalate dehydrogenase